MVFLHLPAPNSGWAGNEWRPREDPSNIKIKYYPVSVQHLHLFPFQKFIPYFFFSLSFLKGSSSTFSLEFLYYSLQPTPVILPGGFYRQRSLAGYSPWGCKESSMTEQLSLNIFSIMGLRVQLERLYSNDILFLVGSLHFKRRCGHSVHLASLPSGHLIR